jgi:hypothetical protein
MNQEGRQEIFSPEERWTSSEHSTESFNLLDLWSGSTMTNKRSDDDNSSNLRDLLITDPFGAEDRQPGNLNRDLPVLGNDQHYGIDPLTGNVRAYSSSSSARSDIWTKKDADAAAAIEKQGYSYGLDPLTGQITSSRNIRTDLYTARDAARDKTIRERGWSYGLNPRTGVLMQVSSRPVLE